mgnify:CR=1 FL=1
MTLYQLHSSSIDIKALAALLNIVSVSQLVSNKPSISNFDDGKAIDNKKDFWAYDMARVKICFLLIEERILRSEFIAMMHPIAPNNFF